MRKKYELPEGWRIHERFFDRHVIEAICPHGVGHDWGTHGCDGCCANIPKSFLKELNS